MSDSDSRPIRYGFLLLPNYSMIAFSSAIEVLRMANRLGTAQLYEWPTYTLSGEAVPASNQLLITPSDSLRNAGELTALFVCGGTRIAQTWSDSLNTSLHQFANKHIILGGLCTGTYVLARARLLDGYHCTIHWENIAALRETSQDIIVTEELFEIDRDRYTAAGGSAPLDMMLQLVKKQHGPALAISISEQFMCDRMRGPYDKQRIPIKLLVGTNQPKLTEAIALMETNLEELIALDDLAR
ncbi:MAG: GlxA family transcriptional regulator, partial [Gammaproteobacteria bacterium]|nr:GlxA family transcriptional regulator [Gammaproteobacteria bacterium]